MWGPQRYCFLRKRACFAVLLLLPGLVPLLYIFVDDLQHPERYVFPSGRLLAVPLSGVSWVDYEPVDERGKAFLQPADRVISSVPSVVLSPAKPCQQSSFLVAVVASPPQDFATRDLIRSTWASAVRTAQWPRPSEVGAGTELGVTVDVFFVLGLHGAEKNGTEWRRVEQEARKHGDLIVGHFEDAYRNLTLKTLTGLNWVTMHCPGTAFVVKVDQDTLLDFPRLVDFLHGHQAETRNTIIGKLYFNSKRLTSGKWMISKEEYPFNYYPVFAGGPCYIISRDAAQRIVNASRFFPPFPMEDVHVTGFLARVVGVRHLHMNQLRNFHEDGDSLCVFMQKQRYQVSITDLSPEKLRHQWEILATGKYGKELPTRWYGS